MNPHRLLGGMITLLLLAGFRTALANDFPLRAKYPEVPVYTVEQLKQDYENVFIVDVRTRLEYSIVHIAKAINNPVMFSTFIDGLKKIRPELGSKKIVFYCNGHNCSKGYKAVVKAKKAGFNNVYVFDAGIFTWINKYPELGSMFGRSPIEPANIIQEDKFNKKMLPYTRFRDIAVLGKSMVIDIRDPKQREVLLNISNSRNIYLDKLVRFIKAGFWKDRQLLIYDDVGKQVRWLQYILVKYGYTNYYFLKYGARGAGDLKLSSKQ